MFFTKFTLFGNFWISFNWRLANWNTFPRHEGLYPDWIRDSIFSVAFVFSLYLNVYYTYIHTYIIGHYNPSVRITPELLTPLTLCALILYASSGTCSLKATLNDRFLRTVFMANLFTPTIFASNLLRGNRRRNFFFIFVLLPEF